VLRLKIKHAMLRISILAMFIPFTLSIHAQEQSSLVDDVAFYADVVANALEYSSKTRANDMLVESFEQLFKENPEADISEINWISQITPSDSSFTIYTWELAESVDDHSYYGYIVRDNKLIKLSDEAEAMYDDFSYLIGDKDLWFGQIYYRLLPFKSQGELLYLLFGYNAFDKYENIKIAEVLEFKEDGSPAFGKPLFLEDPSNVRNAKQRIVLQYSDDSRVNLNYNPGLESIVFDHLIRREGQLAGQGATMIADGSYEGYSLKEGFWIYNEKLFNHVYEEAPRPNPVFDDQKGKKDIFGKSKN